MAFVCGFEIKLNRFEKSRIVYKKVALFFPFRYDYLKGCFYVEKKKNI